MKSSIASMIALAGLVFSGSVMAVDLPQVGKAKCGVCHAVDHKVVGPAFMDVSAKYKGDKDAAGKIAASIKKGGSFGWKFGSMPPRGVGASDADVTTMSTFIAGLAK
jgi:cytochrome c